MAERDWERRIELPALDAEVLRLVIEAHVDVPVERIVPLAGGKVNAHVQADLADGAALVLRIHLRDPAAGARERALLGHFAGRLPVPAVCGHGTCELDGLPYPYLLLERLRGTTLDALLPDLDDAACARVGAAIGRALATVHAETRPHLGFLDEHLEVPRPMGPLPEVWAGHLGELLTRPVVAARLGAARRGALAALVAAEGPLVAALDGRFALLHGDCKPTNVLALPDGTCTGLLDWEFAWSGPPLSDWGQMLRWPLPAACEEALVAGYAAAGGGRHLAGDGRRAARLLDLLNLVAFLDAPETTARARTADDALALLDATLADG